MPSIWALPHAAAPSAGKDTIGDAAFSPDGTTLASIGPDLRLWDVRRIGAPGLLAVYKQDGSEYPYRSISFTRDARA